MAWALPVASVAASALGSITSGYATAASNRANARIADQNAQIALQNATFSGEEGAQRGEQQGLKNRQIMGSIKANQGASGIQINTGSNAAVQASQEQLGQLDVMNIRSNAVRQAYGFQTEATGLKNQANIDRAAGKNAITQGYLGTISGAGKEATMLGYQGAFDDAPWNNLTNSSSLNGGGTVSDAVAFA